MKRRLEEIAEMLNISLNASKIYLELMTHSQLNAKALKALTGFEVRDINRLLNELDSKGLVQKFDSTEATNLYRPVSLMQLEERLDREKTVLTNLRNFIIPQFEPEEKLGIIKYEGVDGIRKVFIEVLEEAIKSGEDILAFENGLDMEVIGETFINNYIRRRLDAKKMAYVITPDSMQDKEYKDEFEGKFTHIKLIPNFKMKANINIVGNLVMTFSLSPIQGTLRRNKQEAETFKAIFWKMWEMKG